MSKIKIEFDTEIDSREDINAAIKASSLAICTWDIQQLMRSYVKYTDKELPPEVDILIDKIHDVISESIGSIDEYTR